MTMFGFMMLRPLDDDGREQLARLMAAFGVDAELPAVPAPPASVPLPGVATNLLSGVQTWGDVSVSWSDGVPQEAWRASNPNNRAFVPYELWQAVMQLTPRDEWLQWVYLAFPESSYRRDAHNPNGEDSWGAWQVNRVAWPQYSVAMLTTYEGCLRAAIEIKAIQGWAAWLNSARLIGLL